MPPALAGAGDQVQDQPRPDEAEQNGVGGGECLSIQRHGQQQLHGGVDIHQNAGEGHWRGLHAGGEEHQRHSGHHAGHRQQHHLMNFESAKDAMEHGFAMITEERKANGLFLKGDLTFNTTIANLKQYKSGIALSDSKMEKATAEEIKTMRTKCMGPNDMISNLSGGNQQKVIFGKWLEREPQVFMMDEPTRGIDVGAKYEIYELIINMAKQGRTIIVVSSEMPEILGITNRIGVMSNGYLSGIVNTKETNQEELLRLSAKYL